MIDLQKLKQFPLAYRQLERYAETRWTTRLAMFTDKLTNEELVLFLDEKNINIQISVKCATDDSRWYLPYIWSMSDGCDIDDHLDDCTTRTSATESAIIKAFELLEKKLNTN